MSKTPKPTAVDKAIDSLTETIELLQVLEELAIAFQDNIEGPLGFHPAFVRAKQTLRVLGRELPEWRTK